MGDVDRGRRAGGSARVVDVAMEADRRFGLSCARLGPCRVCQNYWRLARKESIYLEKDRPVVVSRRCVFKLSPSNKCPIIQMLYVSRHPHRNSYRGKACRFALPSLL